MPTYVIDLCITLDADEAPHASEVAADMRRLLLDYQSSHTTHSVTGSIKGLEVAPLPPPHDEELMSHMFNARLGIDGELWCRDCEYHKEHAVHAAPLPPPNAPQGLSLTRLEEIHTVLKQVDMTMHREENFYRPGAGARPTVDDWKERVRWLYTVLLNILADAASEVAPLPPPDAPNKGQRFYVFEAVPLSAPRINSGKHRMGCEMVRASDYDELLAASGAPPAHQDDLRSDSPAAPRPRCQGCDKGLPTVMVDADGTRTDLSARPGVPSHAVGDAWWPCAAWVRASQQEHFCSGCHHRWEGDLTVVELCGDCWRNAQPSCMGRHPPREIARTGKLSSAE